MYLLQFLQAASKPAESPTGEAVEIEYRLACSGELFNRRVITADWRKSDISAELAAVFAFTGFDVAGVAD